MSNTRFSPIPDGTVMDWVQGKSVSRRQQINSVLKAIWFKWWRKNNISDATIWQFGLFLVRWIGIIVIVTTPVLIEFLKSTIEGKPFTWLGMALIWMVILAFAQVIILCTERWRASNTSRRAKREHQHKVAHEFHSIILKIAQNSNVVNFRNKPAIQKSIVEDVLSVIEHEVRIFFESYGDIHYCASVLLFNNQNCSEVKIYARSDRSRNEGKVVPANATVAYFSAKFGRHMVIHDILEGSHPFGRSGLSSSELSYRSFLCIPVLIPKNGNMDCVGVLTIDSQRAYEFAGGDETDIVTMLKPYCGLLALVIRSGAHSLRSQSV